MPGYVLTAVMVEERDENALKQWNTLPRREGFFFPKESDVDTLDLFPKLHSNLLFVDVEKLKLHF